MTVRSRAMSFGRERVLWRFDQSKHDAQALCCRCRVFLRFAQSASLDTCPLSAISLLRDARPGMQTMRTHALVAVLQANIRGAQVRAWFRASLAEAQGRIADRAVVRRLASIGQGQIRRLNSAASTSGEHSLGKVDFLALQVRAAATRRPAGARTLALFCWETCRAARLRAGVQHVAVDHSTVQQSSSCQSLRYQRRATEEAEDGIPLQNA
jgi:hypothetical protein